MPLIDEVWIFNVDIVVALEDPFTSNFIVEFIDVTFIPIFK